MGYVATTTVNAGEGKVFHEGDKVTGLDEKQMRRLFDLRSIVDENDYEAPTGPGEFATTPRVVRESLELQKREANAPGGGHRQGALTQPNAEEPAPENPEKLLTGEETAAGKSGESEDSGSRRTAKKSASSEGQS